MTSLAMGTYPVNHSLQDLSHRFHLNIPGGCVQKGRFAQELGFARIVAVVTESSVTLTKSFPAPTA